MTTTPNEPDEAPTWCRQAPRFDLELIECQTPDGQTQELI